MTETRKRSILLVLIAATSLPAILLVNPPRHATASTVTLYLSAITGYLGIMLILWMYIIGARSIFGLLFRDIAPIMKIHRSLGTYGALAILLHPLFIVYSYGESLLYAVTPHIGTQFERHVTLGRLSFFLFAIVWVSSAVLRGKMAHRPWKYLHYLAYICLPFALLHVPGVGSQFMSDVAVKAYFYAILLAFAAITVVRIRGFINSDKYRYTISRHGKLSDNTYLLDITPESDRSMPAIGQYVHLKTGIISEDHPFSVVSVDGMTGVIALAYRAIGRFTKYLGRLPVGTTVYVSDPHGAFLEPFDDATPTVFIAGGIGVTPFIAPVLSHAENDIWLFYANRTHQSSLFLPQLTRALGRRTVPIFSDDPPVNEFEESGYLNASILQKHLQDPQHYRYFICGPQGFMDTAKRALRRLNVPTRQIHLEAFEF